MRTLKEDHYTEHIKIVAITALTENREKMPFAGFDGYIPKPITDRYAFRAPVASFLAESTLSLA